MLKDIDKKSVSVESIVDKVVNDKRLLSDLFNYASSEKVVIKYKSLKVFMLLAEQRPSILYPK